MGTPKIYLDICCYNRPFDSQAQLRIRMETEAKLSIQASVRDGVYLLCWSFMLDYENNRSPYEGKRNMVALWKDVSSDYCPQSYNVLSHGKDIMNLGIKNCDALHIACAIERNCDYFITTDDKLTNKNVDDIRIINPIDFMREMEVS